MTETDNVLVERYGPVTIISINRPHCRNAVDGATARKLYDAVGSTRKHLKVFTAAEGGAEHCQVDHRQMGIDYVGDWLLANM